MDESTPRSTRRTTQILAPVAVLAGCLLYWLQRWAGTEAWHAGIVTGGVSGLAIFGIQILGRLPPGHRGRPWAAGTTWGAWTVLAIGALGPFIQLADLVALRTPIIVLAAALPPLMLFAGAALRITTSEDRRS